ncbi:MAG: M18 family aminopeptidase [Bacteroidales bacterium]|nr:M18 family aminopeptidase [Bacteroidales bacterium]
MNNIEIANDLIDFIYTSPSAFHATENSAQNLNTLAYSELKMEDKWTIEKGGKYYVRYNSSAIFSFEIGTEAPSETGFKIIAAHTDSPTIKIKPNPEIYHNKNDIKLNIETYGGGIWMTWLDRPLSIAGRVFVKSQNVLEPKEILVNIKKPVALIPNMAIHLNRTINEGLKINPQKHLLPLFAQYSTVSGENELLKLVASELGIDYTEILDFELNFYETEKGSLVGANNEFISTGRLDNIGMMHAGLLSLNGINDKKSTKILAFFDNEEIGSETKQGAHSPILRIILERINTALNYSQEDYYRAIARSFMISADMAHAIHPNLPEMHDPVNQPVLNGGPVIKINANQKYTTDAQSGSVFEGLCQKAEVAVQRFVNRSDIKGGGTLGSIATVQIPIRAVDIGNPMLAMHSIREFAGVNDHANLIKVFKQFWEE